MSLKIYIESAEAGPPRPARTTESAQLGLAAWLLASLSRLSRWWSPR